MRKGSGRSIAAVLMAAGLVATAATTAQADPVAQGDIAGRAGASAAAGSWTGYNVSVYTGGKQRGQAWGSINWIDRNSFSIPDYWLKDTSCDAHSVYSFVDVSGLWKGKKRWNEQGCGSSVNFGRVQARDTNRIRYVSIWVCRDEITDACTYQTYRNPYA